MEKTFITKKTKVLIFIPTLSNGGAETLVKDCAMMIDRNLIDLKIVLLRDLPNSVNSLILKENNIEYEVIIKKYNFLFKSLYKLIGNLYVMYALKHIIDDFSPDCIHIHLHLLEHIKHLSKYIKDVRLYFTCHSDASRHFKNKKEIETLKYLIKNNGLCIIALHNKMKFDLDRMFSTTNTLVLHNGIDISRFRNQYETKEEIRKALCIPDGAFVIGHVGRFNQIKNHKLLVDIFCTFIKSNQSAFLLLIGNGELKALVENELQERGCTGRFLILSNRTDIPRLLKAMDVFVFPSLMEGMSISLLEAQASGLKCIVSDQIDSSNFLLETTIPVSINSSPEVWCNMILDSKIRHETTGDLNDYDIAKIVKKLEKIYINISDEQK